MEPLLVGEVNPFGADPRYALFPLPPNSAGGRLARILGLSNGQYLRRFRRVNLCAGGWFLPEARAAAKRIEEMWDGPLVLLGAKVCLAFKVYYQPFSQAPVAYTSSLDKKVYVLPHPSGRCRAWNDPGSHARARELLAEFLS